MRFSKSCWKIPAIRAYLKAELKEKTKNEEESGKKVVLVPVIDLLMKVYELFNAVKTQIMPTFGLI